MCNDLCSLIFVVFDFYGLSQNSDSFSPFLVFSAPKQERGPFLGSFLDSPSFSFDSEVVGKCLVFSFLFFSRFHFLVFFASTGCCSCFRLVRFSIFKVYAASSHWDVVSPVHSPFDFLTALFSRDPF